MSIFGGASGTTAPLTAEDMMEAAAKAEISKNLGVNLGASVLGASFDFILFGVMLHQILLWASNFRTEKPFVKAVVTWSGLVATATTAYGLYYIWDHFVIGFGKFAQFAQVKKFAVYGVLDSITVFPIQLFYLERAYRLTKECIWIPIVIIPMLICSLVGGIGITAVAYNIGSVLEGGKLRLWFYLFLAPSAAADILLTALIMYGLAKAKTGWSQTDRIVGKMIRMSFETQLPGTLFVTAFLIYYGLNSTSLFNAFFQLVFVKISVVSLMAVLNYRFALKKAMDASGSDGSGNQRRTNTFNISNRHQQDTMHIPNTDKIKVDTVVYEEASQTMLPAPVREADGQSHQTPELRVGINRQRLPDEESGHSSHLTREHELDDFSSSTRLTHQPSLPTLGK